MLPHLFHNPTYFDFYTDLATQPEQLIILDNGIAEDVDTHPQDLINLAIRVKADEVVIPDMLGDCNATIDRMRKFESYAMENPQFRYIGVVQGQSVSEWLKCLNAMQYSPWVHTIALPRIMNKEIKTQRFLFADSLYKHDWIDKPIHCLGASSWIREIVALSELPIRSLDTSLPFVMGLALRDIVTDEYVPRQEDYFFARPSKAQTNFCEANVNQYLKWGQASYG